MLEVRMALLSEMPQNSELRKIFDKFNINIQKLKIKSGESVLN